MTSDERRLAHAARQAAKHARGIAEQQARKAAAAAWEAKRKARKASPIYFVYVLLDGERPFYVGCSNSDTRLASHVCDARRGKGYGKRKNEIVRQILAEGRELKWRKVAEGLTQIEALRLENKMILELCREYGANAIANKQGRTEPVLLKDRIKKLEAENKRLRVELLFS